LLTSNKSLLTEIYEDFYDNKGKIRIDNMALAPATEEIKRIGFINDSSSSNSGTIVVDDSIVSYLKIEKGLIIGNYIDSDNSEELEEVFREEISKENISEENSKHYYITAISTKIDAQNASIGMKTLFTFVGLYIGIIFAISSATILAIGQLSEASDNKNRYNILSELGADDKIIKKALFAQIGVAFGFPLLIAVLHSIFAIEKINEIIKISGNIDVSSNIFSTSIFVVLVYGGYFIATYLFSKNIINNKIKGIKKQ
jgi:putative ABC transport system permease protein